MDTPEKADEWELLPPNTSFLDFGLEDIKDLFSKEIDYMDYFIEQPPSPPQLNLTALRDEKPLQQPVADKSRACDEKFVEEIEAEDPKQSDLADDGRVDEDAADLTDKRRGDRRRPVAAGIGEILSIGAAVAAAMVCGFLLGSGRRQEQVRRTDAMRFHICEDDKALKQMVRQANRINQVLVATGGGMPPPVMRPAAISFGGSFDDKL